MLEVFGWIGGILLTTCGVPMAWGCYKNGHANGISIPFLWMWFWGEVFVLIYVLPQYLWPLIINYTFNIVLIIIVLWYKYRPRKALTST